VYTMLNEYDYIDIGEQLKSYARMFQHGVSRKNRQGVVMRRIETVTRDAFLRK